MKILRNLLKIKIVSALPKIIIEKILSGLEDGWIGFFCCPFQKRGSDGVEE